MSDDLFECHDCGHVGGPKTSDSGKSCTNCASGFTSRVDMGRDLDRFSRGLEDMRKRGFPADRATISDQGDPEFVVRHGDWLGRYAGGHIDISHASDPDKALDMINNYDYERGEFSKLTSRQVNHAMEQWVRESGEDTMRNKDYY